MRQFTAHSTRCARLAATLRPSSQRDGKQDILKTCQVLVWLTYKVKLQSVS